MVISALAILVGSCSALVVYETFLHPDLESLRRRVPSWLLQHVWLGGVVFAVVNAFQEEVMFRGIFMDALQSQIGTLAAILAQALFFGLLHREGYPPGPVGMFLATLFGVMQGWLRVASQGLLMPIIVHIGADATIFTLVMLRG
jgi:membrane protease YdiL (CAAX protease family)